MAPKTLGAVLSIVYLALAARSLGAAGFGVFALMFSFAQTVAAVVAFQTWQIMIRYGTAAAAEQDRTALARLLALCIMLDLAAAGIGIGLAIGAMQIFGPRIGFSATDFAPILWATALLLLSSRATTYGLLRLLEEFRLVALMETLVPIMRFLGVLPLFIWGGEPFDFLLVWVVSEVVPGALLWYFAFRKLGVGPTQLPWRPVRGLWAKHPDLLRFSGWSSVNSTLKFSTQQFVVLIVGAVSGPAVAGNFRLGHQLGQVLARISDAVSIAFFMEFAQTAHRDAGQSTRLARSTALTAFISALVLALIMLLAGKPLIEFVFGAEFLPALPFIWLLGGAAIVQVGAMTLEPILMTRGHAGRVLLANATGVIVMIIVIAFGAKAYGAMAIAAAVLASASVNAMAMAVAYWTGKAAPSDVD